MRINSNINEVFITKQVEINLLGRHTGASLAAFLELRFEFVRSDRPSFTHQNFFIMRTEKSECSCTCQACSTKKQPNLNELLEEFFTAYGPEDISETLWSWFVIAICSPDFEEWHTDGRLNLAYFYEILTGLIKQLEIIHLKNN